MWPKIKKHLVLGFELGFLQKKRVQSKSLEALDKLHIEAVS